VATLSVGTSDGEADARNPWNSVPGRSRYPQRIANASLGKWFGAEISAEGRKQIWAPAGFARGFCTLSDFAEIQYKCTGIYNNKGESGIRWPITDVQLSEKDRKAQTLKQWLASPESENFKYTENHTIVMR